jgi:hypothetical protein
VTGANRVTDGHRQVGKDRRGTVLSEWRRYMRTQGRRFALPVTEPRSHLHVALLGLHLADRRAQLRAPHHRTRRGESVRGRNREARRHIHSPASCQPPPPRSAPPAAPCGCGPAPARSALPAPSAVPHSVHQPCCTASRQHAVNPATLTVRKSRALATRSFSRSTCAKRHESADNSPPPPTLHPPTAARTAQPPHRIVRETVQLRVLGLVALTSAPRDGRWASGSHGRYDACGHDADRGAARCESIGMDPRNALPRYARNRAVAPPGG